MIDVNDRVPLYPGRVKMTPVSGQANVYDMVRADQPQKGGTPLNRNTFRQTQADIRTYPIATGNSVTEGDVVDVVNGEVTRSVVAEANVKNVVYTQSITGSAICCLNDNVSVVAYTQNNHLLVSLLDNQTGKVITTQAVVSTSLPHISLTRLSDTKVVVSWAYSNQVYTRSIRIDTSSFFFGTTVQPTGNSSEHPCVVALDTDRFVVFDASIGANSIGANIGIVSGDTITYPSAGYSKSGYYPAYTSATLLPDDSSGNKRVCVCSSDVNDSYKGKAVIATINSSNVVTWGSVVTFNDSTSYLISCASNGNTVVASYANNDACYCRVLAINGTSITAGSQTQFETTKIKAESSVICVGGKFVVCGHGRTSGGAVSGSHAIVLNVSGSDITVNTAYQFDTASATYLHACPISDSKFIIAYADNGNNNYGTSTILEVSGNQIAGSFTVNSTQAIALQSGEAGQEIEVIFAGTTAADFVTEGQKIPSKGVYGYGPVAGWLNVIPYWAKDAGVRIATGSYVGTGKFGSANPNSLTFEFEPKFVIVSAASGGVSRLMFQSGQTETYQVGFDSGDSINTIVWSGNTVSWYVKNPGDYVNADEQMNQTNMNYIYLAIG